ncbi:hypothetical protein ABZ614_32700 [Streptomyces sp. NPDC013178]|uniref:SCO2400 family protein n=1 Tax=Streptomyces sp. NPDC013178 TaxID=3155118 RepID=UPI0033ED7E01
MDYCSSCHRHLNGALVCPGCGAYAPDIAPATTGGRIVPAPVSTVSLRTTAAPEPTAWDAWLDDRPGDEVDAAALRSGVEEAAPPSDPSGDLEDVPVAPQGRAARRRQRARWKKSQRRAVVATAVALVGGGLTLASMDRQSGDHTQAATAPKDPGNGALEEQSAQDYLPTAAQPDAQRSSPASAPQTPISDDTPRRQHASAPLPTTPSHAQADAAAAPRTVTVSKSQSQSTAGSSGGTAYDGTDSYSGGSSNSGSGASDTTTSQGSAATATDATDPGTTTPGTSQANPAPASTAPSELCVLVLCLG